MKVKIELMADDGTPIYNVLLRAHETVEWAGCFPVVQDGWEFSGFKFTPICRPALPSPNFEVPG